MMPPPPPEAVELTHELDRCLGAFAEQHERLLRKACSVAPDVPTDKLRSVVVLTMLGHVVSLVRRKSGNAAVLNLVETLVEQLDEMEPLEQLAENTH